MGHAANVGWVVAALVLIGAAPPTVAAADPPQANADSTRPNIVWISCEDTSPWLGFCGDTFARTPNLDALAARGVHYTQAYATAPVCSPARFAIITGCYATSHGTQRLRSTFPMPDSVRGLPSYLRKAGYYCTNNAKTDYNTAAEGRLIVESWDACSDRAHWRNRKPGQPFFAVFNLMETHQSRVFESAAAPSLPPSLRHEPAEAPLPPFYPETAAARRTMARVYDCISAMDARVGEILAELDQAGLREETIVFFWGDHGQGIPRGKRTLWDTGLKVPLVVWFPEKYRRLSPVAAGEMCDRLVSLMDLGPTVLSLAGIPVPAGLDGQAFLGKADSSRREYVFGARDRVDEALDLSRSVRDARYLYIRNFMPDLSWNQPERFSDQLELRREIGRLAAAGKLNAAQLTYAGPNKPREALYDSEKDPWQIHNVADDPAYRPVLERMRKALRKWQLESRDLGLMHEAEAARLVADGRPLIEVARDEGVYPLARVLDTAQRVGLSGEVPEFARRLADANPTVRYWAIVGLRAAGDEAIAEKTAIERAMADPSLPVQVEAAGILARWGQSQAVSHLATVLRSGDEHARLHAARTLQLLGEKARAALPAMQEALKQGNMFIRFSLEAAIEALNPGQARP